MESRIRIREILKVRGYGFTQIQSKHNGIGIKDNKYSICMQLERNSHKRK